MRILAVDDDPLFLDLLVEVLNSGGYENVITCKSAAQALELLMRDEQGFDCFLLDILMPEKDGIALCRDIRRFREYRETPVLMITASTDLENVDRAFAAGATDYISKPIQGLELGSRIRVAKIISEKNRRLSSLSVLGDEHLSNLKSGPKYGFEGEIAIHDVAGLRENSDLENELLRLSSGYYNLGFFALQIEKAGQLFDNLGARAFHSLAENVAKMISRELNLSNTRFTYAGKGLFGCVHFSRTKLSKNHPIRKRLCGERPIDIICEHGEKIEVRLVLASVVGPTLWDGRSAAEALAEAMGKASSLGADQVIQRNLDEWRMGNRIIPRRHKPFLSDSPSLRSR